MEKNEKPGEKATPDPSANKSEPSNPDLQYDVDLGKAGLLELDASLQAGQVPALSKQMKLGGDYWHATRFPLGRAYALKPGAVVTVGPFAVSEAFLSLEIAADPETWVDGSLLVFSPDTIKDGQDAFGRRVLAPDEPYVEEGQTMFVVEGCSDWQQIALDTTAWKGGSAVLEVRAKGAGLGYLRRARQVSDPGEAPGNAGPPPPVWGFADLHSHPMAHIGFGGKLIAGHYPAGSTEAADIGTCDHVHSRGIGDIVVNNWPDGHEAGGRDGAPDFGTWPSFKEGIHQQMHPAWVRRAWEGGLRLVVALVVNSKLLADQRAGPDDTPHDDEGIIAPQLDFWRAVVDANASWMAIATSSAEGRQIIASGRLAVVFGLEVDAFLGSWLTELAVVGREGPTPSRGGGRGPRSHRRSPEQIRQLLRSRLRRLHDLGIRQLNPVHLSDNAFGGSALYGDEFNLSNFHLGNGYFAPEGYPPRPDSAGTDQIDFRLGDHPDALYDALLSLMRGYRPPDYGPIGPGAGHANSRGVNQAVADPAIEELMSMGFIIDVDHMSEHTAAYVLDRCSAAGPRPYPVVSAHMSFRALSPRRNWLDRDHPGAGQRKSGHTWPHESEKSDAVATRILDIGGMLAPITSHRDSLQSGGPVGNDCAGSAKTYAQEFHHAVEMSAPRGRGVGIGTDMALNPQIGPRFGPLAAYGLVGENALNTPRERHDQAWAQADGVVYRQPVSGRPRFYSPPHVDAHERLNPYVLPQDSLSDSLIAGLYRFSISVWRALWLHEAGQPAAATEEPGEVREMVEGFGTPLTDAGRLGGLARAACESLNGIPLDQLTDHGDLNDPRSNQRLLSDTVTVWRDRMRVGPNAPLERCVAGEYGFDFNVDGLAHYGLIPDLLQDLRNVGASEAMLESLFGSAESYLQVWERCEAMSRAGSAASPVPPLRVKGSP